MVSNRMIVTILLTAIVALAGAGCSDDNSPVIPNSAIDTAPPAVPANLSADYSGSTAVINWDMSSVDTDLAGYIVVRERYGVSDTLVSTPSMETSYVDANPLPGTNVYHVYAVDHAGNYSAVATVSLTVVLGHQTADLYR